jgi:hypothetical protein
MLGELEYHGYLIHPRPMQRRDTGTWTLEIQIARDSRGERCVRPFIAGNTFPTQGEAVARCVGFGQAIIDGQVPGCSVVDL